MDYLLLKWAHILSSTILFGTGIGIAFFLFMANLRKEPAAVYFVARHVVMADWIFTTPAVTLQFFTGLGLVHVTGYSLREGWLVTALALYFFAGACWLPVLFMQIRMRDLAKEALERGAELPERYWRLNRRWMALGSLAFPMVAVIFWLMVVKPSL